MAIKTGQPNISTSLLLIISAVLLAAVFLIISFIPCPSEPQFMFYKIILALSVAGLASVLPGFMRIKYKGYVSATGGLAVFVFVLTYNPPFLKNNPRCNSPFNLNVQLYSDSINGKMINTGKIKAVFKGRTQICIVHEDGRIVLEDLPMDVIGEPIQLSPLIEDYSSAQKTIVLTRPVNSVNLIITSVPPLLKVSGSVFYNGQMLKNCLVTVEDKTTHTDEYGNFSLMYPGKEGTMVNIRIFREGKVLFTSTEPISTHRKEIFIGTRGNPN